MNKINIDNQIKIENNEELYLETSSNNFIIEIEENIKAKIIYTPIKKQKLIINLNKESNLDINIFGIDIPIDVEINLNGEKSKINYVYGLISKYDNEINVKVNHNAKLSESNIINHAVNIEDNTTEFKVDAIVPKNIKECKLIQDNKIINLKNGTGIILPNLLIDEFDTFAEHSAYISKFNKDELFYLLSRGLTQKEANYLLTKSFLIGKMNINEEINNEFIELIRKTIF